MRDEKLHAIVARSTFPSQNVQRTLHSAHFWKLRCDIEKVHAVVARSTFPSQNVQRTLHSAHFWKLRCDIEKVHSVVARSTFPSQKCASHLSVGPLLEVDTSTKCTPLWREAHFQVKMYKAPHIRSTFGRSDVVLRGRRSGLCTLSKMSKQFQKRWQAWDI